MKTLIIFIIVIVIFINGYTFIKHKKRAGKKINTPDSFRKAYHKNEPSKAKISQNSDYTKYITKYNSTLDYIDKNDFLNSASESSPQVSGHRAKEKRHGLHNNFM